MVTRAEQLRVFIAFTADCVEERHAVGRIVADDMTIAALRQKFNLSVELFDWTSVGPDAGRPQGLINGAVERFDPDWIVFILWHCMGSDAGCGMTGIEEEWHEAHKRNAQGGGRPHISVYFNPADPPRYELDPTQFARVNAFREVICNQHLALVCNFKGTRDFVEKFRGHLEYSGDLGHPVRRHAGPRFRRKPAGVGAKRRWAFS